MKGKKQFLKIYVRDLCHRDGDGRFRGIHTLQIVLLHDVPNDVFVFKLFNPEDALNFLPEVLIPLNKSKNWGTSRTFEYIKKVNQIIQRRIPVSVLELPYWDEVIKEFSKKFTWKLNNQSNCLKTHNIDLTEGLKSAIQLFIRAEFPGAAEKLDSSPYYRPKEKEVVYSEYLKKLKNEQQKQAQTKLNEYEEILKEV
jgi:hypothetical protein